VDAVPPRPVRLVVTDDLERSRMTVLFRLLLALPHLAWLLVWSLAAFPVGFVVWLAVLVERRAPRALHGFLASYVRYATHLGAYLTFTANPYPSFTGQPGYPVDVEIDPPALQGRWGAAFRLVLAVPALLLAGVLGGPRWWGGGALAVVAVLGWFACLARARMPQGMRDLGAFAIGYIAQTYAYLLLLTDRYPTADPTQLLRGTLPDHPIRVEITDELERSRMLVFFRPLLLLPHLVWYLLWSIPASLAVLVAWICALVTGRAPRPLQRFLGAYLRYAAHLVGFATVVGGPFPGFAGTAGAYPIDVAIDPAERQPRLVTLFRLPLAFPALVLAVAYVGVLLVVVVLGWVAALFTGRMPLGLRNLGVAGVRYGTQLGAYLSLVTDRYPCSAPFLRDEQSAQLALDL
jgi:uncharacterized protein DUF4389